MAQKEKAWYRIGCASCSGGVQHTDALSAEIRIALKEKAF